MPEIRMSEVPPRRVVCGKAKVPLGEVVVGLTEDGELCRLSFLRGREMAQVVAEWHREWPGVQFRRGKIGKGFAKLPLLLVGTAMQGAIWAEIRQLEAGEVASYGEIAERAGLPGRARAVGRACRECSVAYVIPCHRVIAANGLGGYGTDGTRFKEELLALEGVKVGPGRRFG